MAKDLEYYLTCSLDELATSDAKNDIINSANKYTFTYFCQRADEERIDTLLDENGINLLLGSENLSDKFNGLLTSCKNFNVLESPKMCKAIIENGYYGDVYSLTRKSGIDLMTYVRENCKENTATLYTYLSAESQIGVLQEFEFESEEITDMLLSSKKEPAEFLLQDRNIDLSNLTISQVDRLVSREIKIPNKNFTNEFNNKLASISDVNTYRFLIEAMKRTNDMDIVEEKRKIYYEKELSTIGEDGFLEKFRNLKERIITCGSYEEIVDGLDGFENSKGMIDLLVNSDNPNKDLKKFNDYYISNMIVDYLFQDVPTNIIKNLKSMLAYEDVTAVLNINDLAMYSYISDIDHLDVKQKLKIFESLKDKNMIEKFYDDFSAVRDDMTEQINQNIINKSNIGEIQHEQLSKQCGVPVYLLNGQDFYALVRNVGASKNDLLLKKHLDFISDGSSFSLDGSNLLNTFGDNAESYTLAYNGIPSKQLIHAFPTDSFTRYSRDIGTDLPKDNENATDRVINLMTPSQMTSISNDYNEILTSVPNIHRESNDFEEQLEKPEAIAIYCYDEITPNDIESAMKLGLGIILVDTKSYEIDKNRGIRMSDTIGNLHTNKHDYLKKNEIDERE